MLIYGRNKQYYKAIILQLKINTFFKKGEKNEWKTFCLFIGWCLYMKPRADWVQFVTERIETAQKLWIT